MKIEGYEIIRELFSTKEGLTVFSAKKSEDDQLCIVRLADLSNNTVKFSLDDWYDLYSKYEQKVTNYKYLPRVSIITMIDNTKVYTTLDCEEGVTLKEKGILRLGAISNLIDAVQHLHKKDLIHGSIHAGNIWLTQTGKAVLFGAGEASLDKSKPLRPSSDVSQLVDVIKTYSILEDEDIERLTIKNPLTLDELRDNLNGAKEKTENHQKKVKPGLVEQEDEEEQKSEKEPTKNIPPPESVKVKKSPETNTDPINETGNEPPKKDDGETPKNEQPTRSNPQNKNTKLKWIIAGILGVVAIFGVIVISAIILIGNIVAGDKDPSPVDQAASVNTKIEEEPTLAPVEEETQPVTEESVQKPVTFARGEIEQFIVSYGNASIEAVNSRDFSRVEAMLDPNGKSYDSQREYINYLEEKNITETLKDMRLKDSQKVDNSTYKISTQEEYEIYYNDGSAVYKKFNSAYLLKISEDGRLLVNELLYTEETYSESIREAVSQENNYESNSSNNLSNYNNYIASPADETGAIEGAIRLHYGSISNDDFSTAYNVFSKNRRSKVTQAGWEKGLQQNLIDELTTIEVEQIDGVNGRAYIEMTSYDDNKDGTILVQEWAGYWNLVKENSRWTLDKPDLSKVNSRVEHN